MLLLAIPAMICACGGGRKNQPGSIPDTNGQETILDDNSADRIMVDTLVSDSLTDSVIVDSLMPDYSYAWVRSGMTAVADTTHGDSLCPVRRWIFSLKNGSFPFIRQGEFINVKGLEIGWDGRFYIVGGNPLRLVCYKDTTVVYSRELDSYRSAYGLIRLVGDSLWIVEENRHSIIRLSRDGTGDIKRYDIPIDEDASLFGARISEEGYELSTAKVYKDGKKVTLDEVEEELYTEDDWINERRDGWWTIEEAEQMQASGIYYTFKFPAKLVAKKVARPDSSPLYPALDHSMYRYTDEYWFDGYYESKMVFASLENTEISFIEEDEKGKQTLYNFRHITKVPKFQVTTSDYVELVGLHNKFPIRGDYLFMMCNEPYADEVEIVAFDLREMLKETP